MIHFSYSRGNSVNYDMRATEQLYLRRKRYWIKRGYTVEILEHPHNFNYANPVLSDAGYSVQCSLCGRVEIIAITKAEYMDLIYGEY